MKSERGRQSWTEWTHMCCTTARVITREQHRGSLSVECSRISWWKVHFKLGERVLWIKCMFFQPLSNIQTPRMCVTSHTPRRLPAFQRSGAQIKDLLGRECSRGDGMTDDGKLIAYPLPPDRMCLKRGQGREGLIVMWNLRICSNLQCPWVLGVIHIWRPNKGDKRSRYASI